MSGDAWFEVRTTFAAIAPQVVVNWVGTTIAGCPRVEVRLGNTCEILDFSRRPELAREQATTAAREWRDRVGYVFDR